MEIEPSFIGAREGKKALHQIGHARRFMQCFLKRDEPVILARVRTHCAFYIRAKNSKRRLQLVARVGGKSTQGGERCLEPRNHGVECQYERSDLRTGFVVR